MFSLAEIRAAIAAYEPTRLPLPEEIKRQPAVAMILAGAPEALQLCFIKRAEREGDPWSGQMAFPGGRREIEDTSLERTARRETLEEVALDLTGAENLGQLDQLALRPQRFGGVLTPFVYYVGETIPETRPNDEVADVLWPPLAALWNPARATEQPWVHEGTAMRFPGVDLDVGILWGLTLRVLQDFARIMGVTGPPGPAYEER